MMRKIIPDIIPHALHFQPRQISILLTVAALGLWALSLAQAKLVIDDLGIIHSLPVSYFIAVALLTIASGILWMSKENHNFLLGFQLFFFIAMIWLTPLLLGAPLMNTRYEFGYYSNTQYIINFGHLDAVSQWLHSWPGYNLFSTALVEIPGIKNTDMMLIWTPLIIQFIMVLPLYLFFRNTIGKINYCWAAIWIFYLFDHVGQFTFCNQALVYFVMWIILALLVKFPREGPRLSAAWLSIVILLMSFLVMTHLLTSVLLILIMAILFLVGRWHYLWQLMLLYTILIVFWFVFVATSYFNVLIPQAGQMIFRIDLMWQLGVTHAQAIGSVGHNLVTNIRVYLSAIAGAFGLAGLFFSHKFKSGTDKIILFIAGGVLVLTLLPLGVYKGDMITRSFLFSLPLLAYFGIKLLNIKFSAIILLIILVAVIPFNVIALQGNATMDNVNSNQLAYWHFIENKTSGGLFSGAGMATTWSLKYLGPQFIYDPGIMGIITEYNGYQWRDKLFSGEWPPFEDRAYVAMSSYEEEVWKVGYGDSNFVPDTYAWLNNSVRYNLIYSNGDVTSYYISNY